MLRTYNFPNVTLVRWYVGTFVRCFATSHFTLPPIPSSHKPFIHLLCMKF